jgi:Putative Ig domain
MRTGQPAREPAGHTRLAMTLAALLAGITLLGVLTAVRALAATKAPLQVATTYLPPGTASTSYSDQLAATGGTKPYQWSISTGSLPTGLTLHPATGMITGKPTVTGTDDFTVTVTDSESTPVAASAPESITVTAPTLQVTTVGLPVAYTASAYKASLAATGGIGPYTWLLDGGSLPEGLTLHTNGTIAGTPKAAGAFSFIAEVEDSDNPAETATQQIGLLVGINPLGITTPNTLPAAAAGMAYSATLAADGGITPYTWTLVSGSLPPGLTLHKNGTISGTATASAPGTADFTVQVADSENPAATVKMLFILDVGTPLAFTGPAGPPSTYIGSSFSWQPHVTGGFEKGTSDFSIISGTLPAGLAIDPYTGDISGTPQGPADRDTVTLQDSVTDLEAPVSPTLTVTETFTFNVQVLPVTITTTSLPEGQAGDAYSATLSADGGTVPYTWSIYSGSLPAGLTIDPSTGVISGTIAGDAGGTVSFVVEVTDSSSPAEQDTQPLEIVIGSDVVSGGGT